MNVPETRCPRAAFCEVMGDGLAYAFANVTELTDEVYPLETPDQLLAGDLPSTQLLFMRSVAGFAIEQAKQEIQQSLPAPSPNCASSCALAQLLNS